MMTTVLVVGAGGFGAHTARLLAQMDEIDKLVISRTENLAATRQAVALSRDGSNVTSLPINDVESLERAIDAIAPTHVFIGSPTNTHLDYAKVAIDHGARVMSEKPMGTREEGLGKVYDIMGHLTKDRYALQLQMVPLMRKAMSEQVFAERYNTADSMAVYWSSEGTGDVVEDLFPHAWSVLPEQSKIELSIIDKCHGHFEGSLVNGSEKRIPFTIDVVYGNTFRGFQLDDIAYAILSDGAVNELAVLGCSLDEAQRANNAWRYFSASVATHPNPLQDSLEAWIRGEPYVTLHEAAESQGLIHWMR